MGFDETAVLLIAQDVEFHFLGHDPNIQPGRQAFRVQIRITLKNELRDNLLRPCRACLGVGTDDDVVIAEFKFIPDSGVHVVVMDFASLSG